MRLTPRGCRGLEVSGSPRERGLRAPGLKRACTTQPTSAGYPVVRATHCRRRPIWSSKMNTTHAVAGIDPHKRTATVAVVDVLGVLVTSLSFAVTESGIAELLALLRSTSFSIDRVGVEGSGGLGRPVMLALAAAGYEVREVQANRTADRRKRRRRAKTDLEDAEAIARETLADPDLPPAGKNASPPPASDKLAAVRDWRGSLVLQRVRLLNEAEPVLVSLPLRLRGLLPPSSRVMASLNRLAQLDNISAGLSAADRVKLDRLAETRTDIATISARIK